MTVIWNPPTEPDELWQARLTLTRLGIDHRDLRIGLPPGPDVLCEHDGRRVGVEVTRLLPSGIEGFQQDGDRRDTMRKAEVIFAKSSSASVLVHAVWNAQGMPRPSERREHAEMVASAALAILPPSFSAAIAEIDHPLVKLPTGLQSLKVVRLKGGPSGWFSFEYGAYSNLTEADVFAAVERKRRKLHSYLEACDDLWMILLVGADGPSSWASVDTLPAVHGVPPEIRRVFVLSQVEIRAVEVELVGR